MSLSVCLSVCLSVSLPLSLVFDFLFCLLQPVIYIYVVIISMPSCWGWGGGGWGGGGRGERGGGDGGGRAVPCRQKMPGLRRDKSNVIKRIIPIFREIAENTTQISERYWG